MNMSGHEGEISISGSPPFSVVRRQARVLLSHVFLLIPPAIWDCPLTLRTDYEQITKENVRRWP